MSAKISEYVDILIELLENTELNKIPQRELEYELQKILRINDSIEVDTRTVIQYALDNWMIDKILDYDDNSNESVGQLVWFLCTLNEKEAEALRILPKVVKCFIKILRSSNTTGNLGVVRADEVLRVLYEHDYDIEHVPYILGKTDDFFRPEDGKLVQFHYIVPEDEKSEEYKASLSELNEKIRKKLDHKERKTDSDY